MLWLKLNHVSRGDPLSISAYLGVWVKYVLNIQVKNQVSRMHRLKWPLIKMQDFYIKFGTT